MKTSRPVRLAGAGIVLAALAAYHNTFGVPFVFDDLASILDNPSIKHLWPLAGPLSPPNDHSFTVSGRPLLNLTLAVNYAISGTDVWSYHACNLLIHALAGLTLFGLVRRTIMLPCRSLLAGDGIRQPVSESPASRLLHGNADSIAFVTVLCWTLHPLQTESVTYVVQRAESLMGLCYLLALYCFARGVGIGRVSDPPSRPVKDRSYLTWLAASVAACLLGAGCKEVIVTAPVVILLYDRTFAAGSFREAWRQRRWYYAGLAATWLPLAWLVQGTGGDRGGVFVFTPRGFGHYWLTQFEAVTRYLQLSLWPRPLVFEYGVSKVEHWADVAPQALLVLALLGATLWALAKRPVAGFLGASFFVILAPTSLTPNTIQMIVEHRMYLPLAAVLALVTGALAHWWGWRGLAACVVLALVAGGLTVRRNADYQTDLTLWLDTVQKRPTSARAQSGLGTAWYKRHNMPEAMRHYAESVRLDPGSALDQYNLGLVLTNLDRKEEAVGHYVEAVRLIPSFAQAHAELGAVLFRLGRGDEALTHLRLALALQPETPGAHYSLGLVMAAQGRMMEAVVAYETAIKLKPDDAEAENNLGEIFFRMNQLPEAIRHLERALQLKPGLANAHYNLGLAMVAAGRPAGALTHYAEAVRLNPASAEARLNLGILLAQAGRGEEALAQLREAARLKPGLAEAHANLGIALAEAGQFAEAVGSYEEALRLRPDYAVAHYNLGNVLVQLRRWPEARRQFAEAVRLAPDFGAAREMLERLEAATAGP